MTTELDRQGIPNLTIEVEFELTPKGEFTTDRAFAVYYDKDSKDHKSILLGKVPAEWEMKLLANPLFRRMIEEVLDA